MMPVIAFPETQQVDDLRNFPRAFGALSELLNLSDGWNFGAGAAPSREAYMNATALIIVTSKAGGQSFEFFPEDEGGILLIAYKSSESFEILATADGQFEVAFEGATGLGSPTRCGTLDQVENELELKGWQSLKSSGSFTRAITATRRAATRRLLSDRLVAASQLSTPPALPQQGIRVAPMRSNTMISAYAAPPRYSGESRRLNLLQLVSLNSRRRTVATPVISI